ncbi:MAG: hypothetical protein L3J13_09370 [Devosiaceae bacterium]|nr:hypothetical protein [Devosiaceae bacterium]
MKIWSCKTVLIFLTAALASTSAGAVQEKLFSGVWVSNAEFCPLMEKIGTRAIFGNDIAIVTLEQGLVGYEFYCSFDEIAYGSDGKSLVISATCGDSAESFAETIYLDEYEREGADAPVRFEFNSDLITGQSRPGNGGEESRFLFSRCKNLTETMLFERSEP